MIFSFTTGEPRNTIAIITTALYAFTAVDETLRKEQDNQTIGLLLCKGKDKLSVEWALKGTNNPIGVTSYEVRSQLPKDILDKLPTEEEINLLITEDGNVLTTEDGTSLIAEDNIN